MITQKDIDIITAYKCISFFSEHDVVVMHKDSFNALECTIDELKAKIYEHNENYPGTAIDI